jgi:hypothetical protein
MTQCPLAVCTQDNSFLLLTMDRYTQHDISVCNSAPYTTPPPSNDLNIWDIYHIYNHSIYNLRLFSHSIHHYTFSRYLVNLFLSEPLVDMTEFLTEFKQLLVCHGVGVGVLGVPLALLNGSFNRDLLFYLGVMHLHHHLMQKFLLTSPMPLRSLLFFLLHLQS